MAPKGAILLPELWISPDRRHSGGQSLDVVDAELTSREHCRFRLHDDVQER
jgi:hypothetical protein